MAEAAIAVAVAVAVAVAAAVAVEIRVTVIVAEPDGSSWCSFEDTPPCVVDCRTVVPEKDDDDESDAIGR